MRRLDAMDRRGVTWPGRARLAAIVVVALAMAGMSPVVSGADPPAPQTPPSCADRYPADGPAGLDLQLGCVAAEIVASYTGASRATEPARISSWLLPLGAFGIGLIGLLVLAARLNRQLNRRMAPRAPDAWWTCPRCHSLNAAQRARCYACGTSWTPEALILDSGASALQPAGLDAPRGDAGGPPSG